MWAETSPNGKLIWTSSGNDLIAYRASQVTQANAAPSGPEIKPVKTLPARFRRPAITGAVFRHGQLLIAGESDHDYDVWAVDTKTADRKLKLEHALLRRVRGPRPLLRARRPPALDHRPVRRLRLHAHLRPDERPPALRQRPARERYKVHVHVGEGSWLPNEVGRRRSSDARRWPSGTGRAGEICGRPMDRDGSRGVRGGLRPTSRRPADSSVYVRKGKRFGVSNRSRSASSQVRRTPRRTDPDRG